MEDDYPQTELDVIIIGAGVSGINAAYRLQESKLDYSYTILENRQEIGGTWSFFQYPGIRSDSDMHVYGYPWYPWRGETVTASGALLRDYVQEAAEKHGIDKKIEFSTKVAGLDWNSADGRWKVDTLVDGVQRRVYVARYVMMCTGYFDYSQGLCPEIPGIKNFSGPVIHPQFWDTTIDYTDKHVLVIGSGATAVTLIPSMCSRASHVTMLQRSPCYMIKIPQLDQTTATLRSILPDSWTNIILRARSLALETFLIKFCQTLPGLAAWILKRDLKKELPENISMDPHFVPKYSPIEQRIGVAPDGDFFEALRSGKADVVTDHISIISEKEVKLKSGLVLTPDIIVTATGLKLQLLGGIPVRIDGKELDISEKFIWRGSMIQDVPNLGYVFGYTNQTYPLGSDISSQMFLKVLGESNKRGAVSVVATVEGELTEVPLLDITPTYVKNALEKRSLPKAGNKGPWRPRRLYAPDLLKVKFAGFEGLEFRNT